MNALLIHADGRAEVAFGDFPGDLTTAAVLTQAVISALESNGKPCKAVQSQQAETWVTLLKHDDECWLRVTHEAGVTVEQVREWAKTLRPVKAKHSSAQPALRTSLADALNISMP